MIYTKNYMVLILMFNSLCLKGMSQQESYRLVELRSSYNQLASADTQKTQENFFWSFPQNWSEFLIMDYELSHHHKEDFSLYIKKFGELSAINDTLYCAKLIAITRGAALDADGPNMLHRLIHKTMGDDSQEINCHTSNKTDNKLFIMLWLLSRELKGDVMRFWQFYWSSLYFEEDDGVCNDCSFNDDFYRLRDILVKEYPSMVESMTIAYQYFHHGVIFLTSYPDIRSR